MAGDECNKTNEVLQWLQRAVDLNLHLLADRWNIAVGWTHLWYNLLLKIVAT